MYKFKPSAYQISEIKRRSQGRKGPYYSWYAHLDEEVKSLKSRLDSLRGATRSKVRAYGKAILELQSKCSDLDGREKGDSILLACSGGVDSMVLLCHLYIQGYEGVGVAHVNHWIRPESIEEYALVEAVSKELGYQFFGDDFYTESSVGFEERAREFRYMTFFSTAYEYGHTEIMTAHHADDQCESILAHLMRGAHLRGLIGMQEADIGTIWTVRPLLNVSKELLRDYAEALGIPHGEDITNDDISIQRNYIRHVILPKMEVCNPKVREAILNIGEAALVTEDYFDEMIEDLVDRYYHEIRRAQVGCCVYHSPLRYIDRKPLQDLHEAVLGRLWSYIFREVLGFNGLSYKHIGTLIHITHGESNKSFSIGKVKVTAKYDKMEIDVL